MAMTRREVWACVTLSGILSLLLVSWMLVRVLRGGELPDQAELDQLRGYGLLGGAFGIFGTLGWAKEACSGGQIANISPTLFPRAFKQLLGEVEVEAVPDGSYRWYVLEPEGIESDPGGVLRLKAEVSSIETRRVTQQTPNGTLEERNRLTWVEH